MQYPISIDVYVFCFLCTVRVYVMLLYCRINYDDDDNKYNFFQIM